MCANRFGRPACQLEGTALGVPVPHAASLAVRQSAFCPCNKHTPSSRTKQSCGELAVILLIGEHMCAGCPPTCRRIANPVRAALLGIPAGAGLMVGDGLWQLPVRAL